ncbi:MAG: hypothetical protein U1F18_13695 [Steroidobacteraceae bacterium]|jgi:hypothetical protein
MASRNPVGPTLPIAALLLAALSLAPSWAHLLELRPRLAWPAMLWVDATVRGGLYAEFARVGGPVDVITVVVLGMLAWRERHAGDALWLLWAFVGFVLALVALGAIVAPANSALAHWLATGVVTDFMAVSRRWEYGHVAIGLLKLAGMALLAVTLGRRAATAPR